LQHAAVRYALHSYFVQRHAWYVRGLDGSSENVNSSSPASILQDKVEDFVQAAFEQRMGSHGLDLKEMAVLAATYENLVHKELAQKLDATLQIMGMTGQESFGVEKLDNVLDIYMMGYILNLNYTVVPQDKLPLVVNSINEIYPTWPATQEFLRSVRAKSSLHRSHFARSDVEAILEEVFDQYGRWQDRECQDLKSQLLALEDKSIGVNGSGRVRVTDFYGSALHDGNWQFSESAEYLAQNGALDTHGVDRVIIANYVNSPSNCLASSKFYSVCCINECEDLMDHIEHHFAAPAVTPAEIVQFVSSLPSASVAAGRTLHEVLVRRLEQIALRYDGRVPLHGRLFAQWMHHAYPRECPYPHVSGTTKPQTVNDYVTQTQRSPVVSKEQMKTVVQAAKRQEARDEAEDGGDECTEWSHQEELYVGDHRAFVASALASEERSWSILRPLFYVAAIAATLVSLLQRTAGVDAVLGSKKTAGGKDLFV